MLKCLAILVGERVQCVKKIPVLMHVSNGPLLTSLVLHFLDPLPIGHNFVNCSLNIKPVVVPNTILVCATIAYNRPTKHSCLSTSVCLLPIGPPHTYHVHSPAHKTKGFGV